MNIPELNTLQEVNSLLDKVLDGKVENLPEAKKAKELVYDLIEFEIFALD